MNEMRVDELRPGMVLHEGLFSSHGARLLPRGAVLTGEMCRRLRRSKQGVVFVPGAGEAARGAAGAPPGGGAVVQVEPAVALAVEVEGQADGVVEDVVEEAAEAAGAPAVRVLEGAELLEAIAGGVGGGGGAKARLRRGAEAVIGTKMGRWSRLPRRISPAPEAMRAVPGSVLERVDVGEGLPSHAEIAGWRAPRVAVMRRVLEGVAGGRAVDARVLLDLVDELLERMRRRPAWPAHVALLGPHGSHRIAEHAYTVGALCVGMSAHLGWSRQHARAAGLAGMLADAGMLLLPPGVGESERGLGEMEVNLLRRHAGYSAALAANIRNAPESVCLAALQHHERLDGSGYPAGIRGAEIHDLARLVAAADSFAAGSAVRAHRPRRRAFEVIREMISAAGGGEGGMERGAAKATLDCAMVGALVRLVGLFPPGSCVELASGGAGVVVGCRVPSRPERPEVHLLSRRGGFGVVDLSAPGHAADRVVAVLDAPEMAA